MNMRAHRGMKETIQIAGLCSWRSSWGAPAGPRWATRPPRASSPLTATRPSSPISRTSSHPQWCPGISQTLRPWRAAARRFLLEHQPPGILRGRIRHHEERRPPYLHRPLREVAVVEAVPSGSARVVSRIPVTGTAESLHLSGNLLIVFTVPQGSAWSEQPVGRISIGMPSWISDTARTCVLIYDVSDPSAPVKLKEVEIEGTLVTSRIVGGRLHMVQQFLPVLPALDYEYNGTDADQADAVEGNAGVLETLTLDDLIPSYTSVDAQGHRSAETPLVTFRGSSAPPNQRGAASSPSPPSTSRMKRCPSPAWVSQATPTRSMHPPPPCSWYPIPCRNRGGKPPRSPRRCVRTAPGSRRLRGPRPKNAADA